MAEDLSQIPQPSDDSSISPDIGTSAPALTIPVAKPVRNPPPSVPPATAVQSPAPATNDPDVLPPGDLPWESAAKKHQDPNASTGAPASSPSAPSASQDPDTLPPGDLPWEKPQKAAQASQTPIGPFGSLATSPSGDMWSGDNPPEGYRYAAARANLKTMADQYLVGPPSLRNEFATGLERAANTALLNIPRNIAAAINSWYYGTTFDNEYNLLKAEDEALERQNPKSAIAGDVAGIGMGAVALPMIGPEVGATRIASAIAEAGPSLATRMGYGALNSGLYSGAAAAIDTKDPMEAAKAAVVGGALGAGLTPIAEKLAGAASRLWTSRASPVDANGNLTQAAIDAATQAGIDPRDIPALTPHLIQAFQNKGISAPAAREAQLAEFNIPASRGQATADPNQIYRENKFPSDSPFGDLREEQQQGIGASREAISDTTHVTPIQAMEDATTGLQQNAAQQRTAYNQAYTDAYSYPGFFQRQAIAGMGSDIRSNLANDWVVDPQITPYSSRALDVIDGLSNMHVPNELARTPPNHAITGIDMRGVEQARKKLVQLYRGTGSSPDRATDHAVMRNIISEFDNHIQDAFDSGAFSGNSVHAAQAMRDARAAYAHYRQTFGVRGTGDDVGRVVDNIVRNGRNAQDLASYLYTDSQVGFRGIGSRLFNRLEGALGGPQSPGVQAIKEAIKLKLLTPNNPNGQGLISVIENGKFANAQEVAKRINNFLNNRGSTLANRMFNPDEIGELRRFANALNIASRKGERGPDKVRSMIKQAGYKVFNALATAGAIHSHGLAGAILHPLLERAERALERGAERKAIARATAGAPPMQRIAPTFPLTIPTSQLPQPGDQQQ